MLGELVFRLAEVFLLTLWLGPIVYAAFIYIRRLRDPFAP